METTTPGDRMIFEITRPHRKLMTLYLFYALFTAPVIFFTLPILYFRFHTMRYRFDAEGITMSWGLLFRREIRLNYSRIQDIHLTSGIIQRWLGLANLQVQTASGSSSAEMTIEGLLEYEAVRDFLYRRMRGYHDHHAVPATAAAGLAPTEGRDETAALLTEILQEVRATREALESIARGKDGRHV